MLNNRKPSKPGQQNLSPVLKRARKSVYKQALLAGLLIVLTVVVLFAVTVAWYTNIVQTSGLVFEASVWGFDGTVTLSAAGIKAAPGDEGVIELTAENESKELTAVSVNVSKQGMNPEIQKRIFFYVDTSKSRNNEVMERVYLSNQESYTYLLFSNQTLMLTEEVHNDALLKWHWVYDVLGYYVQGTFTNTVETDEEGNTTGTPISTMKITEYLRPIEYDYDEAATTFNKVVNEDGTVSYTTLETIDGTLTAEKFLYNLSLEDGYLGTTDVSKAVTTTDGKVYYPVVVDDTGYGVWAYLCTYDEIVSNTAYDTYLGQLAGTTEAGTYPATITISAQNSKVEAVSVSTATALESAIAAALTSGEKAVIQLNGNITLEDELVIGSTAATQQVMLDLNTYTLTVESDSYSTSGAAIQVEPGSGLTMTNGTLACTDASSYAIEGTGAEVTLSGVTIEDVKRAIIVKDSADTNTTNSDALIRLVDCKIETTDVSVMISGNGTDSEQNTRLFVEDCYITSDYMGIAFNGSSDQGGVSAQVINSAVCGKWAGIYLPQNDATLVISSESVISGYTGLVLKGGKTTVLDSIVRGTGAGIGNADPTVSLSGFCDTGDGIYIESNYVDYHGYTVDLTVDGSTVTSEHAKAVRVYPESNGVSVTIQSGIFSSEPQSGWLVSGAVCTLESDGSYYVAVPATATYMGTYAADDEDAQSEEDLTEESQTESQTEGSQTEEPEGEEIQTEESESEETQTEETQTEETQTEETQTEESQTEETQTEETQTEETQTEETQTEETQTEETQTEETQTEETQTEETQTEETQTEETQTEEAQTEEAQTEESQTEGTQTGESQTEESQTEESQTEGTQTGESQTEETQTGDGT